MDVFSREHLSWKKQYWGALILKMDSLFVGGEILRPESFYEHRHQLIYAAITDLAVNPVNWIFGCKGTTANAESWKGRRSVLYYSI